MEEFSFQEPAPPRPYRRLVIVAFGAFLVFGLVGGIAFSFGFFGDARVAQVPGDRFGGDLLAAAGQTIGNLFVDDTDQETEAIDLRREAAVYGTQPNFESRNSSAGVSDTTTISSTASALSPNISDDHGSSNSGVTPGKKKETTDTPHVEVPTCDFSSPKTAGRSVLVNEIAWMGTPVAAGQTAGTASANEWVELKNNSKNDIDLAGWQLVNRDGDWAIRFDTSALIAAGDLFLLERTDDASVPNISADRFFTGSLPNDGVWLRMFDASCNLIDEVNALAGWPGGESATKKTLERAHDGIGWQTSAQSGGTPRAENSEPLIVGPAVLGATTDTSTPVDPNPITKFRVTIYLNGSGQGSVTSLPAGLNCGDVCSAEFPVGAHVTLKAVPTTGSYLAGWSSPCSGVGECGLLVDGNKFVSAQFNLDSERPGAAAPSGGSGGGVSAAGAGSVLIAEVRAGSDASVNDEFIDLYNPGSTPIDLTGWSIKKKTSNGETESVLLPASRTTGFQNKTIQPGKYLLVTNQGGYSGPPTPDGDWATSNNLAYTNNSLTIYDATGAQIDTVTWSEIPKNKSFARVSWSGSEFTLLDVPTPKNSTY